MEQFIYLQFIASFSIFLVASLFLWLRSEGEKSRKILSFTILLWVLFYAQRIVLHYPNGQGIISGVFASPQTIVLGNLYMIACLPYLFEMVRPGWISWRRLGYLLAPWAAISAAYFITLSILQQPIRVLATSADFGQYIGEFNVWYRIPLFAMNIVYLFILHALSTHYNAPYRRWCNENYSSTENMDISWLKYIAIGFVLITIAYTCIVLNGGSMCYIMHQTAALVTFAFAFYKGQYHTSPYSDKFFKQTLNEAVAKQAAIDSEPKKLKDETSFVDNLATYRDTVERWFVEKEPYLRKEFKLLDVGEVLPLNRSYLSRVFNEGFGQSFSLVVQEYRINKAKEMLRDGKKLTLKEISTTCGFTYTSAFYSTFTKHVGVTPKQWREVE